PISVDQQAQRHRAGGQTDARADARGHHGRAAAQGWRDRGRGRDGADAAPLLASGDREAAVQDQPAGGGRRAVGDHGAGAASGAVERDGGGGEGGVHGGGADGRGDRRGPAGGHADGQHGDRHRGRDHGNCSDRAQRDRVGHLDPGGWGRDRQRHRDVPAEELQPADRGADGGGDQDPDRVGVQQRGRAGDGGEGSGPGERDPQDGAGAL